MLVVSYMFVVFPILLDESYSFPRFLSAGILITAISYYRDPWCTSIWGNHKEAIKAFCGRTVWSSCKVDRR